MLKTFTAILKKHYVKQHSESSHYTVDTNDTVFSQQFLKHTSKRCENWDYWRNQLGQPPTANNSPSKSHFSAIHILRKKWSAFNGV